MAIYFEMSNYLRLNNDYYGTKIIGKKYIN